MFAALKRTAEGNLEIDLEFKAFFIALVEQTYRAGHSLTQIREDIATIRRELTVEDLENLPLEQWAEQTIFALKRHESQILRAVDAKGVSICRLCGKIDPRRETNCASFCPYGA
ncbi:hypothetical protein [Gloeobacter kilaueensis]|uniref:Uncharacterized protein n=1 Tax=Gloeobacter kilaueensis (strain ATCC BAA-2537 / CCAP 1431/1 / ULC 316 / JS1) TaxID=1183438 RepID=U5QIV4_GLOK1|nr:hypothetical protein [Gloeobacter kilaueensis]AGY57620.1 hypothetical protein GKIL_1374 [Gloeobacter kilaueensis JS1]